MQSPVTPPRKIVIAAHPRLAEARAEAAEVAEALRALGHPAELAPHLHDDDLKSALAAGEFDSVNAIITPILAQVPDEPAALELRAGVHLRA